MKKYFLLYFFILSLIIHSCKIAAPLVQHTPTLANMATHTKEKELVGSVSYSTGKDFRNGLFSSNNDSAYNQAISGIQIQSSYSIKSNIALFANYMSSNEENKTSYVLPPNNKYNYKRNRAEIGISFFNKMDDSKKFYSSIGIGFGLGKSEANEYLNAAILPNYFYNHNIISAYLQPTLYWVLTQLHIAIGMKMSFINFNNVITNYTSIEKTTRKLFTENSSNNFTVDYSLKFAYFLKQFPAIGLQYQAMLTSDLSRKFQSNHNGLNMGVGLCFKINAKNN
jgi:hypothetical protein